MGTHFLGNLVRNRFLSDWLLVLFNLSVTRLLPICTKSSFLLLLCYVVQEDIVFYYGFNLAVYNFLKRKFLRE